MSEITTSAVAADDADSRGPSRRSVFRAGGVAGGLAALVALTGEALPAGAATASGILQEPAGPLTSPANIFVVAQTAEQLATTFYRNGILNAGKLGLDVDEVTYLKAAGIEEQLHQRLFASLTGVATLPTKVFSFPFGADTFTNLDLFITTQQILEGVFDSAFIAAVRELARQGAYRAAQIAAQIATIEAEHRVLGRQIAASHGIKKLLNPLGGLLTSDKLGADRTKTVGTSPADNIGYTPVYVSQVAEALTLAVASGFASPKKGNSYPYVSYNLANPLWKSVASKVIYKQPFIQLQPLPTTASKSDRMSALRPDALRQAGEAILQGKGDAYVAYHKGLDAAL